MHIDLSVPYAVRRDRAGIAGEQSHSPRQCGLSAMCFHIDKIAPPTDDLSDENRRAKHIKQLQERNLPFAREEIRCNQTGNDAAIDGKTAVPNADDPQKGLCDIL